MEIFNVHIFEFLLIAGLALVVFGPEKLPDVGRFIGRQLAKFLAWQQQSPEMRMLTEVRSDFEKEIASLRDELVRTRAQLDVQQDLKAVKADVQKPFEDVAKSISNAGKIDAVKPAQSETTGTTSPPQPEPTTAQPEPTTAQPESTTAQPEPTTAQPESTPAVDASGPDVTPELVPQPSAQSVPSAAPNRITPAVNGDGTTPNSRRKPPPRPDLHSRPDYEDEPRPAKPQSEDPPPTTASEPAQGVRAEPVSDAQPSDVIDADRLSQQYAELLADLQALALALREQGVLSADWHLPSQQPDEEIVHRD
jgi:sec-independent protein translocase protein TatB